MRLMNKQLGILTSCIFALTMSLLILPASHADVQIIKSEYTILRATTKKSFEDVSQELEFAITERNYRITGRNVIGKALRKRGYENFFEVDVIHFCNVQNAREVLLLDPSFVVQMPCRILLHEQDNLTVINAVLLPENHPKEEVNIFARRLNQDLRDIVNFALEEYE